MVIGRPVHHRRENLRDLAVLVGFSEARAGPARALAGLVLDRTIAKHQMRKIDRPLVRRRIGAGRHVAHVAQCAGVRDLLEVFRLYVFERFARARIDQIEQARKRITKPVASAAAMADLEDPAHLGIELLPIIEIGILPIDDVAIARLVGHATSSRLGGLTAVPRKSV